MHDGITLPLRPVSAKPLPPPDREIATVAVHHEGVIAEEARMRRSLFAVAICAAVAPPALAETEGQIAVDGRGTVTVAPDIAEIAVAVGARAPRPAEASAAVAARMRAVLAALDDAGIAPGDRQTRHLALHPVQRRDDRGAVLRVEGYEARQALSVTLRDLSALGAVLESLVGAGADEIGGIAFDASDRAGLLDGARRDAVADAQRTAALLAEAAGAGLGPVRSLALMRDHGAPRLAMRAMADEAMPVAPGEITITAEVQAVFAIAAP